MKPFCKFRRSANICLNRQLALILILNSIFLIFLYDHLGSTNVTQTVVEVNTDTLTVCGSYNIPSQTVVNRCQKMESVVTSTVFCDAYLAKMAAFSRYDHQVDIRFIVLTFNRAQSLKQCLDYLNKVHLDGDVASIDIWIDRYANDTIDGATLAVANAFRQSRNDVTVHVQPRHAGLYDQWINTWRPVKESKELAFFLEDDIDISPMAYRWLKRAHLKYGSRSDIMGYSLQNYGVFRADANGDGKAIKYNRANAFLYRVPGVWGFAPHPDKWTSFQNWFYFVQLLCIDFRPYTERAPLFVRWYKELEKKNYTNSMWSAWLLYFTDALHLFSLHANLPGYLKRSNASLVYNRKESGLHFKGSTRGRVMNTSRILLTDWNDAITQFPQQIHKFDYDGQIILSVNR